jgi:hypothetical protein
MAFWRIRVPYLIFQFQDFNRHGEGEHKRQRRIKETNRAIAFIPFRGVVVFRVDQQSYAADLLSDRHAAFGGAEQKTSAKAATLHAAIHSETAKPIPKRYAPLSPWARQACDGVALLI